MISIIYNELRGKGNKFALHRKLKFLKKLKGRFEVQKGLGERGSRDLNENCLIQISYAKFTLGKKLVTSAFTTNVRGGGRV